WKPGCIMIMLVAQLLVPIIVTSPLAFAEPTGIGDGYGTPYLITIVQLISAVIYGAYVISGFILTTMAMQKLRRLLNTASRSKENQKIRAAREEVLLMIYSAVLFLSHSLKCIQQILFAIAEDDSDLYLTMLALYPYINDCAVFSSPVLMLIISGKLRRLISSYFRKKNWNSGWIAFLLAAQLLIPILVASPLAFSQPTGIGNGYGPPHLIKIVQISSAVIYGGYVISGFILTLLAMRKLRGLITITHVSSLEQKKVKAAREEVMLTIYSAALFLSHSLKCIQQILFVLFTQDNRLLRELTNEASKKLAGTFFDELFQYPYINDFAVFSSPVLMLIMSGKLRRLIITYF
ncbi:hypothetical protein PMAYCL1PPCAC_32588, partial [Pristionchus mayeri]